ncbi:MAG: Hpt domain-containing protein, partial [Phormidesmis sp.]
PTLNTQALESLSSDRSFLQEVCISFFDDAPGRIAAVQQAVDQADAASLATTAHALKSLSSCIGAMGLFQICKEMEMIGKSGCTEPAIALMEKATTEYSKVCSALQDYQNTL